ncbi:MAG: hypothetical protein J6A96_01555 [Clostridia bacterium]|nr:hypothetical protein [Clostridia bacterium]
MKKTFQELFFKNAGYFAVLLISLAYIAGSFILISSTGKTIYEIIATGVISLIVGVLITGVFRSLGIQKGEEDERTISTNHLYGETVESSVPYIDKLEEFCELENKNAQISIRKKILAVVGLKYDDCFDENGVCKEYNYELYSEEIIEKAKSKKQKRRYKRVNSKRKKAYFKAVNIKIKLLTPSALTSSSIKENDPFNFGKTKKEYTSQRNISDMATRVVMAIIFGYFGVSFVSEVNFATLIWNILQIVMYITSGIIQMYASYSWIVDEYRLNVIKKIDYLQKFKKFAENKK